MSGPIDENKDDQNACAMLVALIDPFRLVDVASAKDLDDKEKTFLLVTCSARVIERTVCEMADYEAVEALVGFDELVKSMRDNIIKRCAT
jgi:hypothetical protein